MFLHLSDDSGTELIEPMTITGIAHRQIGTHLRIPAAYYDRMREERPDLLAYNAAPAVVENQPGSRLMYAVKSISNCTCSGLNSLSDRTLHFSPLVK